MTFIELLAVSAILLLMAGAMAALAINVQDSGRFNFEQSLSLQHGLVVLQRLQRTLTGATASREFPGFLVMAESAQGATFPDTLVVWYAPAGAVNPQGLPRMNELVVFCPNPASPNELWEITSPGDLREAPSPVDEAAWQVELRDLQQSPLARRVVITDLLRVADARAGSAPPDWRGVLRFDATLRPTQDEWNLFLAGTRSWEQLSWAQGIYGTRTGLRQSRCRFEFQLRPGDTTDNGRDAAIPFFGSGAVFYEIRQP